MTGEEFFNATLSQQREAFEQHMTHEGSVDLTDLVNNWQAGVGDYGSRFSEEWSTWKNAAIASFEIGRGIQSPNPTKEGFIICMSTDDVFGIFETLPEAFERAYWEISQYRHSTPSITIRQIIYEILPDGRLIIGNIINERLNEREFSINVSRKLGKILASSGKAITKGKGAGKIDNSSKDYCDNTPVKTTYSDNDNDEDGYDSVKYGAIVKEKTPPKKALAEFCLSTKD